MERINLKIKQKKTEDSHLSSKMSLVKQIPTDIS